MAPTTNGHNGRKTDGTFGKGNAGGPGNPHARQVARLRAMLLELVSEDDLRIVVGKLVEQAKRGDRWAIMELLDRLIGKPLAAPDPDWLDVEAERIKADTAEQRERAQSANNKARREKPTSFEFASDFD